MESEDKKMFEAPDVACAICGSSNKIMYANNELTGYRWVCKDCYLKLLEGNNKGNNNEDQTDK